MIAKVGPLLLVNIRGLAMFATLAGFLWLAASPAKASAPPPGPSFDCARPTEIESVICADSELSATDRRMAAFYKVAMTGALGVGSNQLVTQREWLRQRDKSCATGAWKQSYENLRACVAAEYQDRLEQLAIATLMVTPNESFQELGRINPKAVPLYRAVYDYASIDERERRIKTVEADLTPLYAKMDANTRDHLQRTADYSTVTAHDAAASDANFAAFFAIFATLEYSDDGHGLTWPCAALVKRPSLIAGLGSYFGGAIDGAIPGSDCEAAMPPMSEVTALSDDATAAQPFCQGTVRFSTGRDYVKLQDAVRLRRTEVWETKAQMIDADGDAASDQTILAWRRTHKARIDGAEAVLKGYYIRYFGTDAKVANSDARSAIDALINGAFESCE